MQKTERVVVIGGDAAGMSAASTGAIKVNARMQTEMEGDWASSSEK